MRRHYSDQERWERASLRVARHMRDLWEEKGTSDTRLLDGFFLPDQFTVVGRSVNYDGVGRREHVVPRRLIALECHRMLENGADDETLAAFIRTHVKIVLITQEECERLDRKAALGLRQTMPDGWRWSDEKPFARLEAAGIAWVERPRTVS